MLGIAVFDDEKIIVDYVGELIKENLDVNAKIYKYTKLEEFKGDCKKRNTSKNKCHIYRHKNRLIKWYRNSPKDTARKS